MINRLFLIFEHIPEQGFSPGFLAQPAENVFYSIAVDSSLKGSLERAYAIIGETAAGRTAPAPLGLTLTVHELLGAEVIRFITSFLFIPSYITLEQRPLINLAGVSPDLLLETANALSGYLSGQGMREPIINIISGDQITFHSSPSLVSGYTSLLQSDCCHNNNIFYYVPPDRATAEDLLPAAANDLLPPAANDLLSTLLSLQQAELEFKQQSPRLYSLILANQALERELDSLGSKYSGTEMELRHQKQYVEVLRSHHATKELQDFYTREYEILPLWYKRFGHIIKVLTGRRTFQSLFRHDVKKYKD
jgi:hypothetical protein